MSVREDIKAGILTILDKTRTTITKQCIQWIMEPFMHNIGYSTWDFDMQTIDKIGDIPDYSFPLWLKNLRAYEQVCPPVVVVLRSK